MKSSIFITLIISVIFISCDSGKPVEKQISPGKDPVEGMNIHSEGLSCDDVWISVDDVRTERTTFFYKEMFAVNFNNVEGFNKVDETVYPGLQLKVLNEGGDTIFQTEDLFADSLSGIRISPLLIKASFSVEKPVRSNQKYTLLIRLWDKSGVGKLYYETPFNVSENGRIIIEKKYIQSDEIYLFSANKNRVITDGVIEFDEIVYLVFEGLSGFYEKNGKIFPGSTVRAIDNLNGPVMYFDDLYKSFTITGINADDFKQRIYVKMAFSGISVENPVHCEATIFDKKREKAFIKASTDISIH